ncbi:hypothetical protein MC059_24395 [Paenibacillus alvei]|nr:hypothetical protein [Paenibacillus alvei]MCY7487503.1 hypothetical protein [Paenibacillus alvei]
MMYIDPTGHNPVALTLRLLRLLTNGGKAATATETVGAGITFGEMAISKEKEKAKSIPYTYATTKNKNNDRILLYHGTTTEDAQSIIKKRC